MIIVRGKVDGRWTKILQDAAPVPELVQHQFFITHYLDSFMIEELSIELGCSQKTAAQRFVQAYRVVGLNHLNPWLSSDSQIFEVAKKIHREFNSLINCRPVEDRPPIGLMEAEWTYVEGLTS